MSIEKLRPSFTFTEDRLRELQAVVPEAFADGKINWDTLREALGEHLEDENVEHFGLTWPGKREARRLAAMPSKGTLVPQPGEGVNEENTHNIFIEGDNLEVLKLLQKSYVNRVKTIYIDPPYNTGNDLIYLDNFIEPLETYLRRAGLVDEKGGLLSSNIRSNGRFHSNWLNMMYSRMLLAKQLLRDDGVIFISIDDNEMCNLKLLMDEVIGEENFINIVNVKAKPSAGASGGGEDKRLKKNIEYLLIYTKNREAEDVIRFRDVFDETNLFDHIRAMRDEGKSWKYTRILLNTGSRSFVKAIKDGSGNNINIYKHLDFELVSVSSLINQEMNENSVSIDEAERTVYRKYFFKILRDTNAQSSIRSRVMEALGDEDGLFSITYIPKSGKNKGNETTVYYKGSKKDQIAWLSDIAYEKDGDLILKGKISTLWDDLNWNNVSKEGGISFPNGKKPIAFIQRMLELTTTGEEEEIILDFFAGSGSTAHAVLDLNSRDNGDRKFIVIQLPEKAKEIKQFSTVSSLCKQRLRNSIEDLEPMFRMQTGFRSYSLGHSQFKNWPQFEGNEPEQLMTLFNKFESPLIAKWNPETLLIELLLLQGFPLDSTIKVSTIFDHNRVLEVINEVSSHRLYICVDKEVVESTINKIALSQGDIFICFDSALSDESKLQLADRCNLKVI